MRFVTFQQITGDGVLVFAAVIFMLLGLRIQDCLFVFCRKWEQKN